MNSTPRRLKFREIFTGDTCVYPGSVFDPISARIAQDLDFECSMFAGSIASLTVLGAPDLIFNGHVLCDQVSQITQSIRDSAIWSVFKPGGRGWETLVNRRALCAGGHIEPGRRNGSDATISSRRAADRF